MGDLSPYKVGAHRHVPEIKQASGAPALSHDAGAGADAARHPGHGRPLRPAGRRRRRRRCARRSPRRTRDEPFVHVLPDGQRPHTAATAGSNSATCRPPSTPTPAGSSSRSAIDNLGKGAAGQARAERQPHARPARDGRPVDRRGRAVSVTAARRASGPPASPPGSRPPAAPDVALVVNDGPRDAAAGRVHRATG